MKKELVCPRCSKVISNVGKEGAIYSEAGGHRINIYTHCRVECPYCGATFLARGDWHGNVYFQEEGHVTP